MKKIIKNLVLLTLLAIGVSIITNVALAYGIPQELRPINEPLNPKNYLANKDSAAGTNTLLQIIAGSLLYFAAPIAVIFIVISAITMIAGGDDTEKVTKAKTSLTWTIIGLLVIILSYSIVRSIIGLTIKASSS